MSEYFPDYWVIIKVETDKETFCKVFGCWSGGYLDGDSWRMNSGIESFNETDGSFDFFGSSGSTYICHKEAYGMNMHGSGVMKSLLEKYPDNITLLDEDEWKSCVQMEGS